MHRSWPYAAVLLCAPAVSLAAPDVEATKKVTWTYKAPPGANDMGKYEWDLLATAKDNHVNDNKPEKNNDTWKLVNGLALTSKTTGLAGAANEPMAKADATFESTIPKPAPGGGGKIESNGNIGLILEAKEANGAGHGKQTAVATGKARMEIPSGLTTKAFVREGKDVAAAPNFKRNKPDVIIAGSAALGAWNDPISVGLLNTTTNSYIEEQLLTLDAYGAGDAELTWDSSGLSFDVPIDGMSSGLYKLNLKSTWITNAPLGESHVQLKNGVFTTSGIFASLPWLLNGPQGAITHASLSPGFLDSINVSYQIPDSLLNDVDSYIESLIVDSSGIASIPEPAGAALMLLGAAYVTRRRRAAR